MTRTPKRSNRGNRGGKVVVNKDGRTNRPSAQEGTTDGVAEWANDDLSTYYKEQKVLSDEEWEDLLNAMRRTLPTTFRLPEGKTTTAGLADLIQTTYLPQLSEVQFEGELIDPPKALPWYPNGLAFEINAPKKVIRKHPEFKSFHQFLVYQTETGSISRQEAVSMIPPLLLEVQPHHRVLDACAAPGSKTAQLVEALHLSRAPDGDNSASSFVSYPTGLVIANDSEYSRAQLLVHQASRLPSASLIVTNLDASLFPSIYLDNGEQLLFDRILCDVPCSGDGTLRKNVGIWKSWNIGSGNGLHSLQLRILLRAMKLLKPGGRIVYSTCALNPVENEAVVAAALNTNADQFYLIPTETMLWGLKRRAGLTSWRPAVGISSPDSGSGTTTFFDTYEEYIRQTNGGEFRNGKPRAHETMWPPPNVGELGLQHCMRIYPQLQNTGGFFVSVIERAAASNPERKRPATDGNTLTDQPPAKKVKTSGPPIPIEESVSDATNDFKELPFTFIDSEDAILTSNMRRLDLAPAFPSSNVFVRQHPGDLMKTFHLANDTVKQVLLTNEITRLRPISAGVRLFARHDGPTGDPSTSDYPDVQSAQPGSAIIAPGDRAVSLRFVNDGIHVIDNFIGANARMTGSLAVLRSLLAKAFPLFSEFEEPFKSMIRSKDVGSYILFMDAAQLGQSKFPVGLTLPLWRSPNSLALMVDKRSKSALSIQIWGADITMKDKE